MALVVGDASASFGCTKRIYDNLLANSEACGFGATPSDAAKTMLKNIAYCIAQGIIAEFVANGTVNSDTDTTVSSGGLQKYYNTTTGLNTDTAAPDAPVSLPGTAVGTIS